MNASDYNLRERGEPEKVGFRRSEPTGFTSIIDEDPVLLKRLSYTISRPR